LKKIFSSETIEPISTKLSIWFYVKLSSAVAAILVGGMKCQTQFWKGITQGSFQQSLVEIGSVVDHMGNSHKNLRLKPFTQ
jgi:hypothetical protein